MNALFLWLAAAAVLALTERQSARILLALAAFATLTALVMGFVGDLPRATLLAAILTATIAGASGVKHHHSGMKLAVADLGLTFAGTIPFMLRQYRLTATLTIIGAVLLALAAVAVIVLVPGTPLRISERLAILAFTIALYACAFYATGGAERWRRDVTVRSGLFSFFMASLIDVASWWPTGGLRMLDVADTPLALLPPLPARHGVRPDIFVIQHESVFDPRSYGLAVDDEIAAFLSPPGAHSGTLHVDIYGGGSWQTEFSLLTGLSSASFGPDSYFLFKKGVGRFAHSLPSELMGLGYRSQLITSCRRAFMNYDPFYTGLGVEERVFSDEFPPPFDLTAFEATNSDAAFFAATEGALQRSLDRDPAPRFAMILTNFNHGPHEVRLQPPGQYEDERRFALGALNDATYAEYYARLAETAASYAAFRAGLLARYPGRPMLIVRYGDHQPTMSRAIEKAQGVRSDDPRQFETFFTIEALNFEPDFAGLPESLDIAQLGTAALKASGLPLDAVSATRLDLFAELGDRYVATHSERKRRFHRTLVDAGMIDLSATQKPLAAVPDRA
ncbi:sulfatase-like hydrolase/transferase [Mesorhizobium sp. BR1-1-16]|uniref:sulfatase-like hydrolase/transferase n=1 Tax=Mesorhizobium sp. BR1-1-16 TaxID=2876653 RepID=UPI001CD00CEE|nr:sulfatase-like hydrolase/transferase [Mesorhizobium sp. BR1-1-16]MBZ9938273.1 sulfatase-like hydrolase/transferase [Mesorhizobium sp. BR1-1-16]